MKNTTSSLIFARKKQFYVSSFDIIINFVGLENSKYYSKRKT